jgi:hypothetical protein
MVHFYNGTMVSERLRCKNREKDELIDLVLKIISYSLKIKKYGLDFIPEEIEKIEDTFLQLGLKMIYEKVDVHTLNLILSRHIISGNYYGKNFLEKMIIMEGMISIIENENSRVILELLLSLFGEEYILEKGGLEFNEKLYNNFVEYEIFFETLKSAPDIYYENIVVNPKDFKHILRCDKNGILKICREIDNVFIGSAIKNLDNSIKKFFYMNLPTKAGKLLFEVEKTLEHSEIDQIENRKRMLFILNKLVQSGEIELEGSEYGLFL